MKIAFFGTPGFAVPTLVALHKAGHYLSAVVTTPDKRSGRGLAVSPSAIKLSAERLGLKVYQPKRVDAPEFQKALSHIAPDLVIVLSYGQILPRGLLNVPRLYGINIHPSLLPQYRGAAPINWAVINGEKVTGITIIRLTAAMDRGEIISQVEVPIEPEDTAITLSDRLSKLIPPYLLEKLQFIEKGKIVFTPQDETKATYAPKLKKEDGSIDWNVEAHKIHNLVRGLLLWPCAYTHLKSKLLKIWETEVIEGRESKFQPGQVVSASGKEGVIVQTKAAQIVLKVVQVEGKRRMAGKEFALGRNIHIGQWLGD